MQIELIGGDYGGQVTPNFFDPGQGGGGIEMGWAADYVQEAYSPSAELYYGEGWAGNFYVVDEAQPADKDVIVAGLGKAFVVEVIIELIQWGGEVYWKNYGSPTPSSNGVNWENSPLFTQGA